MKSRIFLIFLSLILNSCAKKVAPCYETFESCMYKASCGPASYECEVFNWINALDGPIDLNSTTVTQGVMTDKRAAIDNSDVTSLCVGENAWMCCSWVRGRSTIGERLRVYDSEIFGDLSVGKDLIAVGTNFHADVEVNGDISAEKCCFEGSLQAKAQIVTLKSSEADSLLICPCGSYYDCQVVCLKENSIIYGDINFPSLRGKVIMDSTSRILGNIYGGHVVEPFDCYKNL